MDWYPWFIQKYRRKTLHLTCLEHGAYRQLIDAYMDLGVPLPDDDLWLSRAVGLDMTDWLAIAPRVKAFFVSAGRPPDVRVLKHEMCEEQLNEQAYRKAQDAKRKRDNRLKKNDSVTPDVRRMSALTGQDKTYKKEGASRPFKNGFSGKKETEAVAYPDEQKRAEIMKRIGAPTIYSEAELKKQAETIKARLPCPGASPGRVAVMLAHGWVSEEDCRAAGVTW